MFLFIFNDSYTAGLLGNYGQFISGTLGTVITFFAFIGVLFAYLLQNKQLKDLEVENNIRSFRTHFFQLLEIFKETRLLLNIDGVFPGIKLFQHLRSSYYNSYEFWVKDYQYSFEELNILKDTYLAEFCEYISDKVLKTDLLKLESYFRNLLQIYYYIDDNKHIFKNDDERLFYSSIIRNLLSQEELFIIYFYFVGGYALTYLKPEIENKLELDYGILIYFREDHLAKLKSILIKYYDPKHL